MGLITEEVIQLKKQTMAGFSALILQYWKEVAAKLGVKQAEEIFARKFADSCIAWAKSKGEFWKFSLDLQGDDALCAYALKREWYGNLIYPIPLDWKIVSYSPKRVHWVDASWCPLYAGGQMAGIDMQVACCQAKGGWLDTAITEFLRGTVNPKIKMTNIKVRDNIKGACESTIEVLE